MPEPSQLLFPIIVLIGALIPVGVIFARMVINDHVTKANNKRIDEAEKRCEGQQKEIDKLIIQLAQNQKDIDSVGNKLSAYIQSQETKYIELAQQLQSLANVLTKVEVQFTTLLKDVEEIKKELKSHG